MQTSRDSGPAESSTDVGSTTPGYRRPTTTKNVRSHNKDETAFKSSLGHYVQAGTKKRESSQLGPDADY
jgi:hypothetical protein